MTDLGSLRAIQFDEHGLVPAIVQDWRDGTVLMVGYMNQAALRETLQTQFVNFWSRSRNKLWQKGETSGNVLMLKRLYVDCDLDAILVKAEPIGPTCHTGNRSCIFTEISEQGVPIDQKTEEAYGGILDRLYEMTLERKQKPRQDSYVSSLLTDGLDRILKKVVEEAAEVVLAAKNDNRDDIIHEVADLVFHTVVMLGHCEVPPKEIYQELGKRFGQSGLKQKKDGGSAG